MSTDWLDRPEDERFAEALRASAMGPRLAQALGAGACHVLDAKYEPGLRAVVLYDLGGRLVRGDLVGVGAPTAGAGGVVVPGVRLSPFPLDPDLPTLPLVTDPGSLAAVLGSALDRGRTWARHPALLSVEVVRYRPGKRVTTLLSRTGLEGQLVAKVYHQQGKASAVASEAPHASHAGRGQLAFAPTVGHAPELGVVFQERVAGTPLDLVLRSRHPAAPDALAQVRRAATALAELHTLPLIPARQRPVEQELERFGERSARISAVRPDLARAAATLAHRLTQAQRDLPPAHTGPVHGDCKPSQFLLRADRVVLLDLDHLGTADQAADSGTFLASLLQQAARHRLAGRTGEAEALAVVSAAFLDAYLRARGGWDELPRIRWHVAVALERKALRAFARAPRSPLPGALVARAQRCLDELEREEVA